MWAELKQAELRALDERRSGPLAAETVDELRKLLAAVRDEPDADCAICFHGACALVQEAEGRLDDAIRHRELEIAKILQLHASLRGEPASKVEYATQDYGEEDLRLRRNLLSALEWALTSQRSPRRMP